MAKTKRNRRRIVNRATRGCGKCKKAKCRHVKQRGGCGTCVGGRRQMGGSVVSEISGTIMNVFRGFQGQPPIPISHDK